MNNKYIYGTMALALVALLAVGAVSAQFGGRNGFLNSDLTEEDKVEFEAQRQAMQTAIENEDFGSWQALIQERVAKMQQEITEENFQKMIEKHSEMQEFRNAMDEARESGDYSKIQELKEEYDFKGKGNGIHKGPGEGKRMRQGSCPYANLE